MSNKYYGLDYRLAKTIDDLADIFVYLEKLEEYMNDSEKEETDKLLHIISSTLYDLNNLKVRL